MVTGKTTGIIQFYVSIVSCLHIIRSAPHEWGFFMHCVSNRHNTSEYQCLGITMREGQPRMGHGGSLLNCFFVSSLYNSCFPCMFCLHLDEPCYLQPDVLLGTVIVRHKMCHTMPSELYQELRYGTQHDP